MVPAAGSEPLPNTRHVSLLLIVAGVVLISWLHYVTSYRSIGWHEVFQRLYYVPIVVASISYGARSGIAVAALAGALFLPHVFMEWHAWPVFELDQYAEVLVFTIIAAVTGVLADRLRAERDQSRRMCDELASAYRQLEASIEERLRADRLLTTGRLASGMAHEIRNPLAGLLGSLEILSSPTLDAVDRSEFLGIARDQIARLNGVVTDFLEFAEPARPTTLPIDLRTVIDATIRVATPSLLLKEVTIQCENDVPGPLRARGDANQLERALLNLLLDESCVPERTHLRIGISQAGPVGRIWIESELASSDSTSDVGNLFEPFAAPKTHGGLSLAIARRLIENQGGSIRAETLAGHRRCVIELPLVGAVVDRSQKMSV